MSDLQTAEAQVAVGKHKSRLWVSSALSLLQVQSALPGAYASAVVQTAAGRLKASKLTTRYSRLRSEISRNSGHDSKGSELAG